MDKDYELIKIEDLYNSIKLLKKFHNKIQIRVREYENFDQEYPKYEKLLLEIEKIKKEIEIKSWLKEEQKSI